MGAVGGGQGRIFALGVARDGAGPEAALYSTGMGGESTGSWPMGVNGGGLYLCGSGKCNRPSERAPMHAYMRMRSVECLCDDTSERRCCVTYRPIYIIAGAVLALFARRLCGRSRLCYQQPLVLGLR